MTTKIDVRKLPQFRQHGIMKQQNFWRKLLIKFSSSSKTELSVNGAIKKPANVSNCVCVESANYDLLSRQLFIKFQLVSSSMQNTKYSLHFNIIDSKSSYFDHLVNLAVLIWLHFHFEFAFLFFEILFSKYALFYPEILTTINTLCWFSFVQYCGKIIQGKFIQLRFHFFVQRNNKVNINFLF